MNDDINLNECLQLLSKNLQKQISYDGDISDFGNDISYFSAFKILDKKINKAILIKHGMMQELLTGKTQLI